MTANTAYFVKATSFLERKRTVFQFLFLYSSAAAESMVLALFVAVRSISIPLERQQQHSSRQCCCQDKPRQGRYRSFWVCSKKDKNTFDDLPVQFPLRAKRTNVVPEQTVVPFIACLLFAHRQTLSKLPTPSAVHFRWASSIAAMLAAFPKSMYCL